MKTCEDCGTKCADRAVTCSECGSLFPEMIGVAPAEPDEYAADPDVSDPALEPVALAADEPQPQPTPNSVNVCRACGAINDALQRRCSACGSNQLSLKMRDEPGVTARRGRRLTAWSRRPRVGVLDANAPDMTMDFALTFLALGAVKMLMLAYLGGMLAFGRTGPNGLQLLTYNWRFVLAPVAFTDGFFAGAGAFGLYRTRKVGAWLLAFSFALDVLLLGWLVVVSYTDRLVVWPGPGPYVALAFFCIFCAAEVVSKAVRGNLR
jgi:ribosomal protein L40E